MEEKKGNSLTDRQLRNIIAEEIALGKIGEGLNKAPSYQDRLKALDYLAKVNGDYEPEQVEYSFTKTEIVFVDKSNNDEKEDKQDSSAQEV